MEKTEILFAFDTEDFTSNTAADAIYREAEILREEGVRGGFCVVGLVAKQLSAWGRQDVHDALMYHDILSHTYSHSIHPTLHEMTDEADFDAVYPHVFAQEKEGLECIRAFWPDKEILGACPPGNQKNYVAMYAYADMGLSLYPDTVCDTTDGRGAYYCNLYQMQYTFSLEAFLKRSSSEEFMRATLDELATKKRAICFTHPNAAIFSEFWDTVNYLKENKCAFGEWKPCQKRPTEETEQYYDSIRRFIRLIKADDRFKITSFAALKAQVDAEGERVITKADLPMLRMKLQEDFFPIDEPSYCISDMFLAVQDFLLGKEKHVCAKVYGFLDAPYAVRESVTITKKELLSAAKLLDTTRFLPSEICVGAHKIGPADYLMAALDVLCGEEKVTVLPKKQLPSLDVMPRLRDINFKGGWIQSDSFEDRYISERLRLQSWTMRF